jgi:hypothetical protein
MQLMFAYRDKAEAETIKPAELTSEKSPKLQVD